MRGRWFRLPLSGTPYFADDGVAPAVGAVEIPDPTAAVPDAPAKGAGKPKWVDHVVALGVDRAEAEGLTKPELIERAEQLVAAAESSTPVDADVHVGEEGSEAEQVGSAPPDGDVHEE